jgi:hypothetical protein
MDTSQGPAKFATVAPTRELSLPVARRRLGNLLFLLAWACAQGCGGGSAGESVAPPPALSSPAITVTITPVSSTVLLGNTQSFSAAVSNTTNPNVTWSVNGVTGGSAASGTITKNALYTAPADLPASNTVHVTATSVADTTKSATAQVVISSDLGISITPSSSGVELGATLSFQESISSNGHPDSAVRWNLSGGSCPSACGTISSIGSYTAPRVLPANTGVTVTVQSVADPSKQAIAMIQLTSNFTLTLSAPSSVATGVSVPIVATLVPIAGSNPSPNISWELSGAGCSGATCGVLSASTQASGSTADSSTATYTAPTTAPGPNTITITVTPQADPSKAAQAAIDIQAGTSLSLTPANATLAISHRLTLTAQITGTSNSGVNWTVNGVVGGNASVGQLCLTGSNPCQPVTSGTPLQVDYLAPGAIPSSNPVTVQATSTADTSLSATAQITVINHVLVGIQPTSVTLAPNAAQAFTASVLGTANQSVTWQVQGTACISTGVCGTVGANGIYTAPSAAPSPNTLQVLAISSDDPSQEAAASVTIASGAIIQSLAPASVYAGGANGFTLRVDGSGFVLSSPGPGSTLLIAGTARTTTCTTTGECTAPISASDIAAPGSVSVQLQSPDGSRSNSVSLVVAAPNTSNGAVALTSSAPEVDGQNITVVDPTTAGVSVPGSSVDLNVGALGAFSTATNTCTLAGNPIPITPPATGTSAVEICVFSQSGLDTSMTYTVSGPGDVSVVARQPAGLGIIHLTLQVNAGAQTGA